MKVFFVALCIATVLSVAYTQDPTCLVQELLNLQDCVTQLATSPSTFCTNSCSTTLRAAYTNCGYTGALNVVEVACGVPTGGVPTGGATTGGASSAVAVPVMVVSGIVVALASLF